MGMDVFFDVPLGAAEENTKFFSGLLAASRFFVFQQ
jgi:hypothetical protein